MRSHSRVESALVSILVWSGVVLGQPSGSPPQRNGEWIVRDFRFHTGEILPELRLQYAAIGDPSGEPVLILHGSGGSRQQFLNDAFAGELFGPGQALDASRYYIIIPEMAARRSPRMA